MRYDCYCDLEQPSVFSGPKVHRARKNHRCSECRGPISAGERYECVWGVWDGTPATYRMCGLCIALRDYVEAHVPCFCWAFGEMREEALETLRNYAHEAPGLFFGGARLYLAAQRADCVERRG